MRILLTFSISLLLLLTSQSLCKAQSNSDLTVVDFSWSRWQKPLNAEINWEPAPSTARPPMSDEDRKIVERRYGDKMRSDELRKVERNAAKSSIKPGQAYTYKVKVQNTGTKTIKTFYWEYQVKELADPENLTRRQFICIAKVGANKRKGLEAVSAAPPTSVISAKTLGSNSQKPFEEKAVINRVEYADGSFWQRIDWTPPELRTALPADVPQGIHREGCSGL